MSDANNDYSVRLLKELLAINSENPGGSEVAIASHSSAVMRELGLSVELVHRDPKRPNVVARAYGGPGGKRLILQAHLDTKPAFDPRSDERWATDPFLPTEIDGKLHALGACDTKSGAAAQVAAIGDFLKEGHEWRGEIVWIGGADEENGSVHGAALLEEMGLLKADAAIIAEPTNLIVATAQLGNCWAETKVLGRFGHAGVPWTGVDAIAAAMEYVEAVRAELRKRKEDPRFPGHPRLNVGWIEGGYHCGTVPNVCSLRTDIRVRPGETRQEYFDLLRTCADGIERTTGARFEIGPFTYGGCSANEVSPDDPLVLALGAGWQAAEGTGAHLGGFFGGSDAFFFTRVGTPSVVFGPGRLEEAHRVNEYVVTADVPRARQVLAGTLRSYFAVA